MNLGEAIKSYRKEHGISQQSFADACGLSKPYISQLENNRNPRTGEPPIPSADTFVKVASAMHISLQDLLMTVDQNQPISLKTISESSTPIYEAAAGKGVINDGYPSNSFALHLEADQFFVTVCGRSMEPILYDGDIAIVAATSVVESESDIMLVKINGEEATLKHVKMESDGLRLIAENHTVYPTHFFSSKEIEELPVTIVGVVVKYIREMK